MSAGLAKTYYYNTAPFKSTCSALPFFKLWCKLVETPSVFIFSTFCTPATKHDEAATNWIFACSKGCSKLLSVIPTGLHGPFKLDKEFISFCISSWNCGCSNFVHVVLIGSGPLNVQTVPFIRAFCFCKYKQVIVDSYLAWDVRSYRNWCFSLVAPVHTVIHFEEEHCVCKRSPKNLKVQSCPPQLGILPAFTSELQPEHGRRALHSMRTSSIILHCCTPTFTGFHFFHGCMLPAAGDPLIFFFFFGSRFTGSLDPDWAFVGAKLLNGISCCIRDRSRLLCSFVSNL